MSEPLPLLLSVGLLFSLSIVLGKMSNLLHTPRMIGYLIAGILFGPSVFAVFPYERIHEDYNVLIDMTLALIAFSMGEHLRFKTLHGMGREITVITIVQGVCAAVFTGAVLYYSIPWLVGLSTLNGSRQMILPIALVLGAASAATAPAAIMSLIGEYRAKGHFKDVLVGVVALDDVITIMLYGFAITFAVDMVNGSGLGLADALWKPTKKIALAVLVGVGGGALLKLLLPHFTRRSQIFALVFGVILMVAGGARLLGFSPLLPSLLLGITVVNAVPERRCREEGGGAHDAFLVIERIKEAIFGVFFLLAGAHIDFSLAAQATLFAVIITLVRFAGKIAGCWAGAVACGSRTNVRRYLGLSMLPAAGVMVGLTLDASETLHTGAADRPLLDLMVSAVLGATLLNELITPFILRYALHRAGSIEGKKTAG